MGGDCTDESNQLLVGDHPHPAVPHLLPARGLQGPAQELLAVVESKHVIVVFHIVLIEERVELRDLGEGGGGGGGETEREEGKRIDIT